MPNIVRPHSGWSKAGLPERPLQHAAVAKAAITSYLAIHHERPKPFVWTKMAAEIFASVETDLVDVSQIHETSFLSHQGAPLRNLAS